MNRLRPRWIEMTLGLTGGNRLTEAGSVVPVEPEIVYLRGTGHYSRRRAERKIARADQWWAQRGGSDFPEFVMDAETRQPLPQYRQRIEAFYEKYGHLLQYADR